MDRASVIGLRRYRNRGVLILAFGAAMLVGSFVAISVVEERAGQLERTGARVAGLVTATRGAGESGSVTVDYTWQSEILTGTVHLAGSSPHYRVAQPVTVIVDPADPDRMTLPGETNQSPASVWPMIGGLVLGPTGIILGLWMLVRTRRQRRTVAASSWTTYPARHRVIYQGRRLVPAFEIQRPAGEWQPLRLANMTRWRMAASGLRATSAVEAAGDD